MQKSMDSIPRDIASFQNPLSRTNKEHVSITGMRAIEKTNTNLIFSANANGNQMPRTINMLFI